MKQQNGSDSVTASDIRAFTPSMLRPDDRDAFLAVRDYFTGHGIDVTVHGSALEGDRSYQDIDLALSGSYSSLVDAVDGLRGFLIRLHPGERPAIRNSVISAIDLTAPLVFRARSPNESSRFMQATGLEHSTEGIGRRMYLGMSVDRDLALLVGDTQFDLSLFYDR